MYCTCIIQVGNHAQAEPPAARFGSVVRWANKAWH